MASELDNITAPPTDPQADGTTSSSACDRDQDIDTERIAKSHAENEFEREKQKAEELIKDSQQNRSQRKEYAEKIFWLVCAWLVALVITVWKVGAHEFQLTDTVIVALISGASVNIIGLMVIVANYLFPKNGSVKNGE